MIRWWLYIWKEFGHRFSICSNTASFCPFDTDFFSGFCRGQESGSAWRSSLWSSCNHSSYVLRSTQGESTRTSVFVPSFITYRLRGWHWFLPQVPWSIIYCLFQFPVLCSEFFKLTTCLCEMYPAKMSLLPEELFKNLMASLEVGLSKYPFQRRNSVSTRIIFDGQNPHLWLGKLPSIFLFNTLKNGKKYWARFISQSPDMWDHFVSSFGPTSSLIRRFFYIKVVTHHSFVLLERLRDKPKEIVWRGISRKWRRYYTCYWFQFLSKVKIKYAYEPSGSSSQSLSWFL